MALSKTSSYKIEYFLVRLLEILLSAMPRKLALKIGAAAGVCLYFSGAYRKTVRTNMKYVGRWTDDQIEGIIKQLYKNIGRYATDFIRNHRILPAHSIHNFEILESAIAKGKGVIAILGHFGNWELLANVFGKKMPDLNVIAKPMKNGIVDEWLAKKREAASVKTIYTKQALRKMVEVLKRNGIIAILIDQYAGNHGNTVPFLGKDANTVRSVAGLVYKTGCSVVPTFAVMRDDGSYDIMIYEAPSIDTEGKSQDQCILEYQKLHNDILSEWILNQPEHYFGWFHKRFRGFIKYS